MSETVARVIVFTILILGPPAAVWWFGLRHLWRALKGYGERGEKP